MDDMIELRGFEEPVKKSKKGGGRAKEDKDKEKDKEKKSETRKESVENGKVEKSRSMDDSGSVTHHTGPALPESDAELAAILGLLDMPDDTTMASLFDKGNPSMPPTVVGPGGVRAMRLEDIEKAISTKDSRSGSVCLDVFLV
ncbi:unnamed protein product [Cylicostephanus goldi]|uniref:Uncharacterized protein n=1 Tax=Cylicostephanus goldi TaxID=71465 RepID=A0A3P7NLL1_CYLGO|nr:unnamed protein product [Cylicostephanus goldi]